MHVTRLWTCPPPSLSSHSPTHLLQELALGRQSCRTCVRTSGGAFPSSCFPAPRTPPTGLGCGLRPNFTQMSSPGKLREVREAGLPVCRVGAMAPAPRGYGEIWGDARALGLMVASVLRSHPPRAAGRTHPTRHIQSLRARTGLPASNEDCPVRQLGTSPCSCHKKQDCSQETCKSGNPAPRASLLQLQANALHSVAPGAGRSRAAAAA